jgi:glycosyltransferase involved in cell wall biosynthesis
MYPNSKIYLSGIFVHEQVKALTKLGIEVTVIAPVPYRPKFLKLTGFGSKPYDLIPKFEVFESVPVYHSRYIAIPGGYFKGYWGYPYSLFIYSLLNRIEKKKQFDLIHAHGSLPDDFGGYLLSKRLNKPLVVTVHGQSVYSLLNVPRRFKYSRIALENADALIAVSSKVEARIRKFTDRHTNIHIVYNGYVDRSNFAIKSRSGIINILFSGELIERKGCKNLLLAFGKLSKKYDSILLTIAGAGDELKLLKNITKNLSIENKVHFEGAVPHSKMLELMNSCDIFVLPSWDEAFGVVYLEAMSFKKPVIGSFGEGISDIITDGENGLLVNPRDVENLTQKLEMLISSESLRKRIGENGYESIKRYTWNFNAQQTIQVYKRVL